MTRYKLKTMGHSHIMTLQNNKLIPAERDKATARTLQIPSKKKANAERQQNQPSDLSVKLDFFVVIPKKKIKANESIALHRSFKSLLNALKAPNLSGLIKKAAKSCPAARPFCNKSNTPLSWH